MPKLNKQLKHEVIQLIEADAEPLELLAMEDGGDDEQPKLKKFAINAYTGGKMNVGFGAPVVVDLSGIKVSAKSRPILKDHDPTKVIGHTTNVNINAGSIKAEGVVSGANQHVEELIASSGNGFPWQASIGAQIDSVSEIDRGETVQVNGRTFRGPLLVARKSTLKEISFVALGADDNTNARVAAKNQHHSPETFDMDFNEWLEAKGFDPEQLEDAQAKSLKAMYEAEIEAQNQPEPEPEPVDGDDDDSFDMKAALADYKAGVKRVEAVKKIAADHPEILAKAIDKDWDATRTELEVLRAKRPEAPNINTPAGKDDALTNEVLTAAICVSGNLPNIDKQFDDETLQAAHDRYKGRIGLQEMLVEAARANGYSGSPSYRRDARGVLQAAFNPASLQASGGFSTLSITDILSNTANKFLLAGYNSVESGWRSVSAVASVSDFKTHTRYRLTGDMKFEKVGAGGEIKHGTLADQAFTNKAETYAKMIAITRQDQINDDLGALTSVPQMMGADAARNLNTIFWTEFLDNSTFFTSGNANLETSNALSIGGLTTAELAFLDQTDPDGNPLGIMPSILLVPNALKVLANQLYNSTNVDVTTTANTPLANTNPHAGNFTPVVSSYLGNTNISGSSTSSWYLLANPSELPVIETAFLDGVQNPTIETADADFSTLGIQMRGYMDFGIAKQDHRAGVKCTA